LSSSVQSFGEELLAGMVKRLILCDIVVLLTCCIVRLRGHRVLG
jgi:hypothetical protein